MNHDTPVGRLAHFLHKKFIWFLLAAYALATMLPGFGLWLRDVSFGQVSFWGSATRVSLSICMLSFLLFNAGLGAQPAELIKLFRRPVEVVVGLIANLMVPIAFIFCLTQIMRLWHSTDEVQNILVGLALVASMPIAGSSTAWSQNANGNMALSLGLVLLSTFLSPLTTPLALDAVGFMTKGDYSEDLHELASGGTNAFLAAGVILPSILGIGLRAVVGGERIAALKPWLKLTNLVVLFLLIYSSASVSLPEAMRNPDYDFLAVMLVIAGSLCLVAFGAGWLLARMFHVGPAEQASLMFGLGMNNNGTGLVLASMALSDHPKAMLPIIFYNLVQHLVAGVVDRFVLHHGGQESATPELPRAAPASA